MGRYARAVARFPYIFLLVDILLAGAAGPITVWLHGFPDLSDPTKGFEPRGTEIKGWQHTAQFVQESLANGSLSPCPWLAQNVSGLVAVSDLDDGRLPGGQVTRQDPADSIFDPKRTPKLVVTPTTTGSNLLSADHIQAICRLHDTFLNPHCFDQCDVTSLGTLIAASMNKSCGSITEDDVVHLLNLVQNCSGPALGDARTNNTEIAGECLSQTTVRRLVNHFTDEGFVRDFGNKTVLGPVTYSPIYLQWKGSEAQLEEFYKVHLHKKVISNDLIIVEGMDLLLGRNLFRWFVKQDIVWYGLAMALVVIILVIYLRSPSLMLTVILNVTLALSLSYWFYFMICRFNFFPFINILAALLLIAVGADDLFIFYDIWRSEKRLRPSLPHEELVACVLHQGGVSVFVTSLTTAAALLANLVNDVTAIRCFGVFAAVCIMMNFLLFITWVPAILVLLERASETCEAKCKPACRCKTMDSCSRAKRRLWSRYFPKAVSKGAPWWIILCVLLSAGAFLVIFWKPKLNLPTSSKVRSLIPNHPFEVYTWDIAPNFRFESEETSFISIQYLFGAHGADNGDLLDANNVGHLDFDQDFDIHKESSQIWLSKFCHDTLGQDFIDPTFKNNSVCFWDMYAAFIQEICSPSIIISTGLCCNLTYPLSVNQSETCLQLFRMNQTNNTEAKPLIGQPLFDYNGHVMMFQMTLPTIFTWSANYEKSHETYTKLSDHMDSALESAPRGLDTGWFTGAHLYEFRFYDLQTALSRGTLTGIGVSLTIGFIILLLTTLNVVLTMYAITTITFVLATTAGALALMGWELGASESLTLTLSMGLSIDFTIHLGVAYNMAPTDVRELRVQHAFESVGSAVTMAALTTFSAGAAMMLGQVWAYRQFGTFLVLTMVFSWFYAMLFFMSLFSVIGPTGDVGNIKALCCRTKSADKKTSMDLKLNGLVISSYQPDRIRAAPRASSEDLHDPGAGPQAPHQRNNIKYEEKPKNRPDSSLHDRPPGTRVVGVSTVTGYLSTTEHGDICINDPQNGTGDDTRSMTSMTERDTLNVMLY